MPVFTRRAFSAASVLFALLGGSSCAAVRKASAEPDLLADADVHELIRNRIDTNRRTVGIAVGIVAPGKRRLVAYGRLNQSGLPTPRADTVFELASVTKVFTALLLADMAQRGELRLDDPVGDHLPAGVTIPERGGRRITLLDLATHTSGLPYWAGNLAQSDQPEGPEALSRYTFDDLHEFLRTYVIPRDVGTRWEYSTVGYALLGEALSHRADMDFEALVRTRIAEPLGMSDTGAVWTSNQRLRAATGHDAALNPVPERRAPFLVASGGLHSTAGDMMRFLAALVDEGPSRLRTAVSAALVHRRPAEAADSQQALGWLIRPQKDGEIAIMLGGGFGFASAVAIDPARRCAVIVLSNSIDPVADIAMRVLRPGAPVEAVPVDVATEVQLDSAELQRYVGRYKSEAGLSFEVFQDPGGWLALRFPGATPRLRARSATEFFTDGGAEIDFHLNELGQATRLELRAPSIPRLSAERVDSDR